MASDSSLPLVAVLTPVYNGEKYLAESMRCVQQSDYPNLVHVILDNASTDRTAAIIDSFCGQRVPLLVSRNPETVPLVDNHNAVYGRAPAEAKYVRLLCADDLMAPSAISKLVEVAERDDAVAVVGCLCRNVGLLGPELQLPRDCSIFPGAMLVRAYLRHETSILSGTHYLFRRSAVEARRPPLDEAVASSSDTDLAMRIALTGSFGFVHEVLAEFRLHEDSYSATVASRNGDHLFEWLVLLDRYGPAVLSPAEHEECRKVFRHHYLRRALLALVRDRDIPYFLSQTRRLAELNDSAGAGDFGAALLQWVYLAATGQRNRVGAPRRMMLKENS